MLLLADDTEDAPWMVMGDLQFWSASQFATALRTYARQRALPWYVASMLPIQYAWPDVPGKKTLAPDVFVAFVPERPRSSYDLEAEGQFPAFILEVVSPSSTTRDVRDKLKAYELLGAREYVLFTPRTDIASTLEGYRLDPTGKLQPIHHEVDGGLKSEILGLTLIADRDLLRARTPEGRVLPTLEDLEEVERDLEEVERARAREEEARRAAEAEVERLRRELERIRGEVE
jgi:Uma2 family endonuclease